MGLNGRRTSRPRSIELSNPTAARISPKLDKRHLPNRALKELRINLGVSPEQLGGHCRPPVSGKAIRNAERGGLPHVSTQLAIVSGLNRLRLLSDPDSEPLVPTNVFPTERTVS